MLATRDAGSVPARFDTGAARTSRSDDYLRIALIGCGKMGQHHARAIARIPARARLVAAIDPSPVAREAVIRLAAGAVGFASLAEALVAGRIDVVHVCTTPDTHEAIAADALEAGCHIYVEKPFVASTAAAARLLDLARVRGLRVSAGHQLLFEAPSRSLRELLPALGTIVHVESYFSFRTVRRSRDGRTPMRADHQLLDILPHPVYLLLRTLEQAAPESRTELVGLERGHGGTVHALVRRGSLVATLVVSLDARPVESYLRVVGTNGLAHADFVRGTVQRLIGPGTSGIDKALNPFRLGRQLLTGTTAALARRVARRQLSYPGLVEMFEAFYGAIVKDEPFELTPEGLLDTTRICERIATVIGASGETEAPRAPVQPRVVVTGGTGFLGRALVHELSRRQVPVAVLARREPAPWDRAAGVRYSIADLGVPIDEALMRGAETVIHCAAETAGGFEQHERNSVAATESVLRAAAAAGVKRVVHVSSLAVLQATLPVVTDESPLENASRERGPYVWGKAEAERRAVALGAELGIEVLVARPAAIVDPANFEPPGRLGKRIGNVFVAVGSASEPLGVVELGFAARALAWLAFAPDAPRALNLVDPRPPTKRELVRALRRCNPDLTVLWMPWWVLTPLSLLALGAQRVLRPGRAAISLKRVFAGPRYDTRRIAALAPSIGAGESAASVR